MAQLSAASGADEARLRRILFGPGRIEAGPARRVGLRTLEAWTTVRTGDWLWVDSALNQVVSVEGGRMKARASVLCDTERTDSVVFQPGEVADVMKHVVPILVDSADVAVDGLYSIEADCRGGRACDVDGRRGSLWQLGRRLSSKFPTSGQQRQRFRQRGA